MIRFVLLCCFFVLAYSAPKPEYKIEDAEKHFQEFIEKFEKHYSNDDEKAKRFEIFKENLKTIIDDNNKYENVGFGINQFTDLTIEEFRSTYLGTRIPKESSCQPQKPQNFTALNAPDELDWRKSNVVTEVKNQGNCGSCWAFGTIANLESQYAMKYKKLSEFSEQQLMDCSTENGGCGGGLPDKALAYVIDAGGVMSESSYPYKPVQGACQFSKNDVVAKVSSCTVFNANSEDEIKDILNKTGPLTICM